MNTALLHKGDLAQHTHKLLRSVYRSLPNIGESLLFSEVNAYTLWWLLEKTKIPQFEYWVKHLQ